MKRRKNIRLEVECYDATEIRMGSPYNICKVRLTGDWVPDLPQTDWQDIFALREDRNAVVLVRWDTSSNIPGFRLYIINGAQRTTEISERFPGCCSRVHWMKADTISWEAFPDLQGTYHIKGAA